MLGKGTQGLGMGGLSIFVNIQVICDCGGACETSV